MFKKKYSVSQTTKLQVKYKYITILESIIKDKLEEVLVLITYNMIISD